MRLPPVPRPSPSRNTRTDRRPLRHALCVAVGAALAGCATTGSNDPATGFDPSILSAVENSASALAVSADTSQTPTSARLTTADSRLGPWLLGGSEIHQRLYLGRLREAGYERVVFNVAYPTMTSADPRAEEYQRFYGWIAQQIEVFGLKSTVVVSPQFKDSNHYRGIGLLTQCDTIGDAASRLAGLANQVVETIDPETVVIDVRPTTLTTALGGCDAWANDADAARLLKATLAGLNETTRDRVAVGINSEMHPGFQAAVLANPDIDTVSVSTLDIRTDSVDTFRERWSDINGLVEASGKRMIVDAFWWRKPVRLAQCDGKPEALTDVASVWQPVDAALLRESTDTVAEYVTAYETDLLFDGYISAEVFECGEGFLLKNRRLAQLNSREARRYRKPVNPSGAD